MRKVLVLLFFYSIVFSQEKVSKLEDTIYYELDKFVEKPSLQGIKKLEHFQKDLHPKTHNEVVALFTFTYNLGYYQNQFGFTEKAIQSYEKAFRLYQKNKLHKYEVIDSCLKPLGNLYTIIGDYHHAENIIKHYFYIANIQKNNEQKFAAIINLSNVYQNTGRISEAIDLLENNIRIEKLNTTQRGTLLGNLGANYILDAQIEKAKKVLLTSIELLKNNKSESKKVSNTYRNLSKVYSHEGQFEQANDLMEKARDKYFEIPDGTPREQAKLYYDIALLDFQQNRMDFAKVNIQAVYDVLLYQPIKNKFGLPNKASLYAENTLIDALDLQAKIFQNQNQIKKSLAAYTLSFHVEELVQTLLINENSKIINQIRNRNRTEKCISIYQQLYKKEKDNRILENAFLLCENTKASVLKEALFNSKKKTPEEKKIEVELQNWHNVLIAEQQKRDFADLTILNKAIVKQNELLLLLKTKKENNSSIDLDKGIKLKDLFLKLNNDKATLVEYFYGNDTIYVFVIENNTIQLKSIVTNVATKKQIISFLDYFTSSEKITNDIPKFNQNSNGIYKLLQLPKPTTNKNLILVPDGLLHFLPFDCLITKLSTTTNFSKMHYLLHDFKISYSNSSYFYTNATAFPHQKETVLGVFPIFENSRLELDFSKKELSFLKKNLVGKFIEKQDATFSNFQKEASKYSILHFSTHATSGDLYEPAKIKFYDKEVMYSEFYSLKMNPNLVVLGACETGLGKLYKAEGAMSVARGFQFAGAQNILFSLWKVNDFTTSVLMNNFYSKIKKGVSYSHANHQVKVDFLKDNSISNAKKSPYYWSAFVYYGTLESNPTTNYFIWIAIGVGVVGLVFLFLFFRKKGI